MAISAEAFKFMRVEPSQKGVKKNKSHKGRTRSSSDASSLPTWQIPSTRELLQKAGAHFGQATVLDPLPSDVECEHLPPDVDVTDKEFFEVQEDASMHERWLVVLDGRGAVDCPKEELRLLVDAGTPLRHRHLLWPRWWAQADLPAVEDLQTSLSEETSHQIEIDLKRTFGRSMSEGQRHTLRRVLHAYATHNPEVGYCQGMSFIAALPLILEFSEANAFAVLKFIVEEICPGYHGPRLEGYFRDIAVLQTIVHSALPEVHIEMELLDMPFHLLATDHLLTLSARTWPLHPVVRLWDVILLEGSAAVLASFLALLQLYFLDAVEASRAAGRQPVEIPTDAASRFKEMARVGVCRAIDELIVYTRKFIPMVRQGPAGERRDGSFLSWLRAEVDREVDREASSCQRHGELPRSCSAEVAASTHSPASASGAGYNSESPTAQDVAKPQKHCTDPASMLLVEALVTIDVGNVQPLRVGAVDRVKTVVLGFVRQHSLDKKFADALTDWLKKAEARATKYPITIEGEIHQIYQQYLKNV